MNLFGSPSAVGFARGFGRAAGADAADVAGGATDPAVVGATPEASGPGAAPVGDALADPAGGGADGVVGESTRLGGGAAAATVGGAAIPALSTAGARRARM